jgi:Dyp-type peroxidase family
MQNATPVRRHLQPAYEDEFGEEFAVAWHETMNERLEDASGGQFYNPATLAPRDEISVPIAWTGFPRRVTAAERPEDDLKKLDELFDFFGDGDKSYRPNDEYLEWRVEKNPRTQKLSRIVFTCEFPEYYGLLAGYAPDKLLGLYRRFVSPSVQLADLFHLPENGGTVPVYNRLNKWNTTHGIMHLALPINELGALTALSGFVSLHKNVSATAPYLTESARLVSCAAIGNPNEAADLQVGSMIAKLAQTGALVSFKIPVAVYIAGYDTKCITDRDGAPVPNFWRVLRGHPGIPGDPSRPSRILRLAYAVPDEYRYELGDLYVDGRPVRFGGQLARHVRMQVIATAAGSGPPPAETSPCADRAFRDVRNHDVLIIQPVGSAPPAGFEPAFPHDADPQAAQAEPYLELSEIQGNIVVGFNKPHQAMVGVRFGDIRKARAWLREIERRITFSDEAFAARANVRLGRSRGRREARRNDAFTNIVFSAAGLERLGVPVGGMAQAFIDGQWRRAPAKLGDPVDTGAGALSSWVVGGSAETTPDVMIVCAADRAAERDALCRKVVNRARRYRQDVLYVENGDDLPATNGITGREHFGFKDNIAKVRLRGEYPKGTFYNARNSSIPQDPVLPEFSERGEPLVWPGQIVLGYPRQSRVDTREPLPAEPSALPWLTKNGSYLVFRRLRQNVALFRQFVRRTAEDARQSADADAPGEALTAALLVGRWPDGTPLSVEPLRQPAKANPTNDFVFARENWPPGSASPADVLGSRCPVTAHIRKVNPRDQGTDFGPPGENLRRAMLRRGIPYGRPFEADESDEADRGLLFLAYQASIEETFETIVQSWMNSASGPTPPPGFDMLVGRAPEDAPRYCTIADRVVSIVQPFVYATGGGYFFAPSRSAIRRLVSGKAVRSA